MELILGIDDFWLLLPPIVNLRWLKGLTFCPSLSSTPFLFDHLAYTKYMLSVNSYIEKYIDHQKNCLARRKEYIFVTCNG